MNLKTAILLTLDAMNLEFNLQGLAVSQLNMTNSCDLRLPRLIDKSHERLKRRLGIVYTLEKKGGDTNGNTQEKQSKEEQQ